MASWSEVSRQFLQLSQNSQLQWLEAQLRECLSRISELVAMFYEQENGDNVIFYFSAFLQKPEMAHYTQMQSEDVHGFMSALHGLDRGKNLTVILHTPGGDLGTVETIIEYVHDMFKDRHVTVIVPVLSASAGTIFTLSCDRIIISRIGQLGPIDAQMILPQGVFSVKEIIDQFNVAKADIENNLDIAAFWAPILSAYGPALQQRAINIQNDVNSKMRQWLLRKEKSRAQVDVILEKFHDQPNVHDHRIGYDDLHGLGLDVRLLEDSQELQDAVLTAYHLAAVYALNFPLARFIINHNLQAWERSHPTA